MYILIVLLTMLVLPVFSIILEHGLHPDVAILALTGRWFVFWGVGVRLGLAGLRQALQPRFTSGEIFRMTGDEALPIIRELGFANMSTAVVALASIAMKTFVLPAAIAAGIFYAAAGFATSRFRKETVAMTSDFFMSVVLGLIAIATLAGF